MKLVLYESHLKVANIKILVLKITGCTWKIWSWLLDIDSLSSSSSSQNGKLYFNVKYDELRVKYHFNFCNVYILS